MSQHGEAKQVVCEHCKAASTARLIGAWFVTPPGWMLRMFYVEVPTPWPSFTCITIVVCSERCAFEYDVTSSGGDVV